MPATANIRRGRPTVPTHWQATRQQVLNRDNYRCVSCSESVKQDADVHHLLPRSMGGTDELANLVTLCDGCHASHHPTLAGGLARRAIERWAVRLARWLDTEGLTSETCGNFGPALRLFGVERFRHGQLPIVLAALAGKSVLVVSPTGSGKTLCFQLPAVLRRGISIVVSPLKTLMSEQVSDLLSNKIPATFINSDLSSDEKGIRFNLIARQAVKMLYLAPERFFVRSEAERQKLKETKPAFLVVDEAHCVDQWGGDFRREYGRLREVREKLGSPPVLAFTATAGIEMQKRILASLGVEDALVFVRGVDRPNIALIRSKCAAAQRALAIAKLIRLPQLRDQKVMIFVPSAKVGEHLQQALRAEGLEIPFYHSRLGTSWERQELLKRFLGQSRPVADQIICTNAFGMGLDVPNVRLVIHWQHSASVEDQLQEFGRAGRDGKQSVAVMFHDGVQNGRDTSRLAYMANLTVEGAVVDPPTKEEMLKQRLRRIDQVGEMMRADRCVRNSVNRYFEGPPMMVRRSLSLRILDWAFGSKDRSLRFRTCCDHCDRAVIQKVGLAPYVAQVLR
ncbi:RecQ family ATP-dependent DNA helicase [Aminobacter ciceronei]|nr:RecQ family ATP-dependent DNA helicase [Aminobacter ciceronei]